MTVPDLPDPIRLILPAPYRVEPAEGVFRLQTAGVLRLKNYHLSTRPMAALFDSAGLGGEVEVEATDRFELTLDRPGQELIERTRQEFDAFSDTVPDPAIRKQAYALTVGPAGAAATAGGTPGLFYAAVTLSKLISRMGACSCVTIRDRPGLPHRAALLDVSRGRVPTLASLKDLVSLLAELKFNQLTFNIEHLFACKKHPEIGAGHDPITADEMSELADFAALRHVEIIPFQQSFGHLRGILSLPQYQHLAYDPRFNWTVMPGNDETYRLLGDLYDAQLRAAGSRFFHVGGDEPHELVKYYDPARFAGKPLATVLADHYLKLHELVSARGKTMMLWADALVAHPEILMQMPKDMVLCHWSYGTGALEGPDYYRPQLDLIAEAGLPFYACTSTANFLKLHPDLAITRANHNGFAPEAKKRGAMGLMTTIWGEMGHMNLTGLEAYPLALAARHAWEDDPDRRLDHADAYSYTVFGDDTGTAARLAETADRINRLLAGPAGMGGVGFLLFWDEPLFSPLADAAAQDLPRAAAELKVMIAEGRELLARMETTRAGRRSMWLDYHLAMLQAEYLARKLETISYVRQGPAGDNDFYEKAAGRCDDMAQLVSGCLSLLESRWLANNKTSGLELNRERHRRLIHAWRARAAQLRSLADHSSPNAPPPSPSDIIANPPPGYTFNVLAEIGLEGML